MMNNMSDFYDKLDLKYPEIAVAMQDVYTYNPRLVKFAIPVLTPNMDNSKPVNSTIYQNKANLRNNPSVKLEIENIKLTNYIEIPIQQELLFSLSMMNNDESKPIISIGSKWIVIFVGGDITKPRIISRYAE